MLSEPQFKMIEMIKDVGTTDYADLNDWND